MPLRVYDKVQEASSVLPSADLYVFEDSPSIMQKDPHALTKMHQLLLQTALVALLNEGKRENR